ncbi:MAG: citrate transporter [Acidobacteria bacterium]|nr:citrate transporter [Acidobacteriota bacterium]
MSAILILLIFVTFAALMFTRRVPALIAVPLMAVLIAAAVGTPFSAILDDVVSAGSVKLAAAYVAVFAGAMLGRGMMQTGIAEGIIKRAAEFGGDRPLVVAFGLMLVTAVLFTSLTGLGAIIMVGSLVLPIMMSLGIPRRLAGTYFLLAFATGFIFNISLIRFYRDILQIAENAPLPPEIVRFQLIMLGVMAAGTVLYTIVSAKRAPELALMTVVAKEELTDRIDDKNAPLLSFLTPLIPLVLYFGFNAAGWKEVPSFLAGSVFGALVAQPKRVVQVLSSSLIRGLEDGAPAAILMMGIGMLVNALQLPAVKMALEPLIANLPIANAWTYVLFFGVLSPLALYRGPFNLFGLGAGFFAIVAAAGIVPAIAVLAAAMAIVQLQNVCDPTNTHNVWVANYVGVRVEELTKATLPTMILICFIGLVFGALLFLK